jgi:hypothetical protein
MTLLLTAEARGGAFARSSFGRHSESDCVLKALRNQVQLAEAAGIGQGFLSELEARMKTGSAETLAKLAQRLDVPVGWLG